VIVAKISVASIIASPAPMQTMTRSAYGSFKWPIVAEGKVDGTNAEFASVAGRT
jgi:hypothetical protein